MQQATYQTVVLSRGKHASPEQGACVMELASMIAGEPFSDHPRSVSRSIAAFLRAYNDVVDDERRRDLYEYAAKVVGTAGSEEVEDARAERLRAWAGQRFRRRARWSPAARLESRRLRKGRIKGPDLIARYAIRGIGNLSDGVHGAVLSLVDELIRLGPADEALSMLADVRASRVRAASAPPTRAPGCDILQGS